MNNILFLSLTTEKYANRRKNILETWGSNVNLVFYSEHEDSSSKVIKVCDENNAELKQCAIFKYIENNCFDYEWYFFCDDDTFVNTKLLFDTIDNFGTDCVTGQDIYGAWQNRDGYLHYPAGGAGFLINRKIIHKFFDISTYHTSWGDVSVGLKMKEKNILMCHNTKFLRLSYDDSRYWIQEKVEVDNIKDYYTFHYIDSLEKMKFLHDKSK